MDRDPRGRIISTSYMSLVNKNEIKEKAGSDAAETAWFDLEYKLIKEERIIEGEGYVENKFYEINLSNEGTKLSSTIKVCRIVNGKHISYERHIVSSDAVAFDHGRIIQYAVERLRNKLETSDIAFHLMPDLFTLTELQKAYEKILDKPLLKANFRRKINPMVKETDNYTSDAGHRPSRLFKFNSKWMDVD